MKKVLAVLLVLAAIAAGIYFGLVWALVGGIVLLVDGVTSEPADDWEIGWGVARICLCGLIGFGVFVIVAFPAAVLWESAEDKAARKRTAARRASVQAGRRGRL